MLIGKPPDIPSSAITSKDQYLNRRRFLRGAVSGAVATGAAALGADRLADVLSPRIGALAGTKLDTVKSPLTTTGEQSTSYDDVTHYNNFYEFGVNKDEPAKNAGILPTRPWTIRVDGKVKTPKSFDIDTLLKLRPLEDRIYRHRCVEAWSMVIPWVGYSLSEFIKLCDPLSTAKYVQFLSYYDKHVEKWSLDQAIYWPYSEGLRMDEAMNPLALLDLWPLRRGAAQPERRARSHCRALEVRIQVRQVDSGRSFPRQGAVHHMERSGAERVWVLLQREPQRRSSALEPEDGAAHRLALLRAAADDAVVQWLWRTGGFAV